MQSTPQTALVQALQEAERFIAGFEDDPGQPGAKQLLEALRTQISVTLKAQDTRRVTTACATIQPTEAEIARFKARLQVEEEAKRRRMAALPPGTCPECEGEGTLYSALHSSVCTQCDGSGKLTGDQGGAA